MRTTYYTATSLDGFIADATDSLEWLFVQTHEEPERPALRYDDLVGRVGALVMGATTYTWIRDRVVAGTEAWSYDVPTWVLTHRDLPGVEGADVRFVSGDVAALHSDVEASAAGRDLWVVGGGDLAGQYADAGLLDDLVVSTAPVTLGEGRPLLPRRLQLRLDDVVRAGDFVCARYLVDGPRPSADWLG
ncbi:dihydrofolate reductase family protein [Nocardioides sp. CFH 31398]|uniref:dihydrofolate reductase family protein n=1 Tax=Nocardioides sp. CFH 31398 TaxID=2919579 RepID=UPI001F0516FD|nr:dihydrofolate reductase family protein [Nocardioides sp. CFH 31398]MCH1867571.1 dihydrofolate reductase family protein [Nocardioides sp. CFH 31398]